MTDETKTLTREEKLKLLKIAAILTVREPYADMQIMASYYKEIIKLFTEKIKETT
jgi:hypothetical protein